TVVFCDLMGSTSLGERMDSESLRELLRTYFAEMKAALERHGGLVEKYIGDAIMAVFGLPRVREDDALRAVRAAVEMQTGLARLNQRLQQEWGLILQNRTGVNTGEVVAGDPATGQQLVTGDTVNVAARLEQACPAMGVLLGETTYRLVRSAVEAVAVEPLALKGKAELVPAYQLLGVHDAEAIPRTVDATLVGRDRELGRLRSALSRAERDERCQLVTVFAPAGIGKSRLIREFVDQSQDQALVLHGHCLSYGDNITFWPLAEMTREAASISDGDTREQAQAKLRELLPGAPEVADRMAAVLGLDDQTFSLDESFWAAARLLEELAARRPTIVVIEDIHWAEEVFLKLVRHVAEVATGPLVLACSSRPELLEQSPDWGSGDRVDAVTLSPLSPEESLVVVENLLGSTSLDSPSRTRIAVAAGGNPLYVEQMISMLIDDGTFRKADDGSWAVTRNLDHLEVPPSISALIAARLDRLGVAERAVLERGAVIGLSFSATMVAALCPEGLRGEVASGLATLTSKEFLRPDEPDSESEPSYLFLHALIRETTYGGLLKRTRAELHEAHADWLEAEAASGVLEQGEIRGYHLEQAYLIRTGLGRVDEGVAQLGRRGASYLTAAGDRALSRGDMPAAGGLLGRAAALLPPQAPDRLGLLIKAGDALSEAGNIVAADEALAEAARAATELGHRGIEASARVALLNLRFLAEGAAVAEPVLREAEAALGTLAEFEDHLGMARAWRLILNIHLTACRFVAAEAAAHRVIDETRRAGDRQMEDWIAPALAGCAQLGPTPVGQAISLCNQLLLQNPDNRRSRAVVLWSLSHLEAMRGNFDQARGLYRESRSILEELGIRMLAALTSTIASGPVELLAGDPVGAESELRRDYESLRDMGER
ncbi:MAG TPA: adenylate/guanylate cyclase domain-containing protein, partial [Candidatus Micrarchaeaceae archaeon]|nr:adenylate/guanylate cyclase domain-containing protein [Candidatus Micrarchaeaceae archaeon]